MSHFTVLVLGENIEKQLQPFHEFECTGTDDEFVQDIDITENVKADYAKQTKTRYRRPDGTHMESDNSFYRDPTESELEYWAKNKKIESGESWREQDWNDGLGYRMKIWQVPAGFEKCEIPTSEIESLVEFAEGWEGKTPTTTDDLDLAEKHKYGYTLVDADNNVIKIIDRTNPNKQWDWWVVGGRWRGYFKLKPGATGKLGNGSLILGNHEDQPGMADSARKCDIDFDGMMDDDGNRAAAKYDRAAAVTTMDWESWASVRERITDIDAARDFYKNQPQVKALNQVEEFRRMSIFDYLLDGRDAVIQNARDAAIMSFAFIHDGKWYEKGKMGWWGIVSNEDLKSYETLFHKMLAEIPDDTLMTIVDCHI